jgi:ABC-type uncharacterized transport system permease subunit
MLIRLGSLAVAAVAITQWWQLADRAAHITRMYWKFGDFPVTASGFGLSFFMVCSIIGIAMGILVVRGARAERGWPHLIARISTVALAVGAVVWPAAAISPFVRITQP